MKREGEERTDLPLTHAARRPTRRTPHTARPREATQPDPVDPRHCAPPTPERGRPWRERERGTKWREGGARHASVWERGILAKREGSGGERVGTGACKRESGA
jgi:hypothetical protein